MRTSTKALIGVVVACTIYFAAGPQIREARINSLENEKPVNAFSTTVSTPEITPEVSLEKQEVEIDDVCKAAESALSDWDEVCVCPVTDPEGSTIIEVSIISDDAVTLAKQLCEAGQG